MHTRIGLAIGARDVRVVSTERGVVKAHTSIPFNGVTEVETAVADAVSRLSQGTNRRITVAIGPSWVDVKVLRGLPALKPPKLLHQVVQENQHSFFLFSAAPRAIARLHVRDRDTIWAAAYNKELLDAVARGLRTKQMTMVRAIPAIVAVSSQAREACVIWRDGEHALILEGNAGGLRQLTRVIERSPGAPLPEGVHEIDADAVKYVDAYGAATLSRRVPLAWDPEADPQTRRKWDRVGRVAATLVLTATAAFAALGPGIRASRFAATSRAELERLDPIRRDLLQTESQLASLTRSLDHIAKFRRERGRVSHLLSELAATLPESTALVALHIDSTGGTFTAISTQVSGILPELVDAKLIASPRVVGSVTREAIGGAQLQRATFRFHRPPARAPIRGEAR